MCIRDSHETDEHERCLLFQLPGLADPERFKARCRRRVDHHETQPGQDHIRDDEKEVGPQLTLSPEEGDLRAFVGHGHQSATSPASMAVTASLPFTRYWRTCPATGAATPPPDPPRSTTTVTT